MWILTHLPECLSVGMFLLVAGTGLGIVISRICGKREPKPWEEK